MEAIIAIFPTFTQRIKFLFCSRVVISGSPKNIKKPMNIKFY
jgi:hypothetical protein